VLRRLQNTAVHTDSSNDIYHLFSHTCSYTVICDVDVVGVFMFVTQSGNVALWIDENALTDAAAASTVTPGYGIVVVNSSLTLARSIRTYLCVEVRIKADVNCVNSDDQVAAVFEASV